MDHRSARRALVALAAILSFIPGAGLDDALLGPAHVVRGDVRVALGGRTVTLGVTAIGRGLPAAVEDRAFAVDGESAERDLGGGATEWWRRAPRGVEHGVTLERRLAGAGPLRLELGLEGASAEIVSEDTALLRSEGRAVGYYAGLVTVDARGRRLPSRLAPRAGGLAIEVDDESAVYPIVVDPLMFDTVVMTTDAAPSDRFGDDVDASAGATRLLVGTSGDDLGTFDVSNQFGSARVMLRAGTRWTDEASLTLPTPAIGDAFGTDVSLSDDGSIAAVAGAAGRPIAVFARVGTTWSRETVIVDPSATGAIDLSADGSSLAVARTLDTQIWTRTGTTWAHTSTVPCALLVTVDAAATRAVCRQGGVEVYVRAGTAWALEQHLLAPDFLVDALDVNGAGDALAVSGKVGALNETVVFERTGSTWTEGGRFPITGTAVDASDTAFLVGTMPAVLLGRAGTTWAPLAELTPRAEDGGGLALDPETTVAFSGVPGSVVLVTFLDAAALGETCTADDDCLSLHCVDGACCTAPCAGACESCDAADTGDAAGVCSFVLAGRTCRAPSDLCDAEEVCTGASIDCPTDELLTSVECRPSAGACDPPELCFGTSAACPPDLVAPASMVCRTSSDVACDPLESCDGVSAACPADVNACAAGDAGTDAGDDRAPDAGTPPVAASGCACRARAHAGPALDAAIVVACAVTVWRARSGRRSARRRAP